MFAWTTSDWALIITAIIAFVALVRPEISWLWHRFTNSMDYHRAGQIEVGFSTFGPTIGLQGTLRAVANDQFVRSMYVTVVRDSDHSRHSFEWAVFRPPVLLLTPNNPQGMQVAAGFLVQTAAPQRVSIQFHDRATAAKYTSALSEIQRQWTEYLQTNNINVAGKSAEEVRSLYGAFTAALGFSTRLTNQHQIIDREFYWMAGSYNLQLVIFTSRPDKTYYFFFKFTLTGADSDNLRLNVIASMLAACNVPNVNFNFAGVQFEHPTFTVPYRVPDAG